MTTLKISFLLILFLTLNISCDKNVEDVEILTKLEFQYDLSDIEAIIKLADIDVYNNLYGSTKSGDLDIEVGYDGRYHEDHQHATCVPPKNLCYIIITAPAPDTRNNHSNPNIYMNGTLIKILPEKPESVSFEKLELRHDNGKKTIIFE